MQFAHPPHRGHHFAVIFFCFDICCWSFIFFEASCFCDLRVYVCLLRDELITCFDGSSFKKLQEAQVAEKSLEKNKLKNEKIRLKKRSLVSELFLWMWFFLCAFEKHKDADRGIVYAESENYIAASSDLCCKAFYCWWWYCLSEWQPHKPEAILPLWWSVLATNPTSSFGRWGSSLASQIDEYRAGICGRKW